MAAEDTKRTVLLCVDNSPQCEASIKYYMNHVHQPDNHVVLSHVIELPDMAHASTDIYLSIMEDYLNREEASISPTQLAEQWQEEIKKSKETESKYKHTMKEHGVENVKMRLEGGTKPGQVICNVATEEKANMIVIGTRGMGTIRRTILGSVSDYVVHHAHCPVMVCRHAADIS